MILNNINFLSFLILIVFTYLIYDIYQINNTQIENFFRRRRGRSIFSRIKSFVVKKIVKPVSNLFNIQKRLREAREKAAAAREAARRLQLDNIRKNYQTKIDNINKEIKETKIPNLSKTSQSAIKKMNDSKKITKNIYIKSLKDDILTNYNNMIYN